jgi:hypothetical protein
VIMAKLIEPARPTRSIDPPVEVSPSPPDTHPRSGGNSRDWPRAAIAGHVMATKTAMRHRPIRRHRHSLNAASDLIG